MKALRLLPMLCLLCLLLMERRASCAPHLGYIYPAGGQRGTTVRVTFSGSELDGMTGFFTTGTGLAAKVLPGSDAGTRVVEIRVAADAPSGMQQVRLYGEKGLTNPKFFQVGVYPEQLEKEPNNTAENALKVTLPVTVNGRIQEGSDVDAVTFHARPDETIVCEIHALRILGEINDSWLKGYMEIRDASGAQLAESEGTSDDFYRWDPLILFTPPKEGDYTLFYRDLNWRGAPMAVYRLTLGVVPHAVGIFPLGGRRGSTVAVDFAGANLHDAKQKIVVPADASEGMEVAYTGGQGVTNLRPFQVGDLLEALQTSANHALPAAQILPFPCVVNGRLEAPIGRDYYRFHVAKKMVVVMELFSRRLGTPMDSEITLYDLAGKQLDRNDDARDRDSRLEKELMPGDYIVMVRDIDDRTGPAFSYRLAISPPQPHFHLLATPDAPRLTRGSTITLTVRLEPEEGFAGDVPIRVEGLPAGVTAAPLTLIKAKPEGQITLTATPDAATTAVRLEIIGTSDVGGHALKAVARSEETYNIQGTAFQRRLLGPILLITAK